jgi:hypothetical protein
MLKQLHPFYFPFLFSSFTLAMCNKLPAETSTYMLRRRGRPEEGEPIYGGVGGRGGGGDCFSWRLRRYDVRNEAYLVILHRDFPA